MADNNGNNNGFNNDGNGDDLRNPPKTLYDAIRRIRWMLRAMEAQRNHIGQCWRALHWIATQLTIRKSAIKLTIETPDDYNRLRLPRVKFNFPQRVSQCTQVDDLDLVVDDIDDVETVILAHNDDEEAELTPLPDEPATESTTVAATEPTTAAAPESAPRSAPEPAPRSAPKRRSNMADSPAAKRPKMVDAQVDTEDCEPETTELPAEPIAPLNPQPMTRRRAAKRKTDDADGEAGDLKKPKN